MPKAESGKTVKVHYTGKLNDGSMFDTSEGKQPLEFEVGAGQMIPGFEEAILGMEKGEKKTVKINPEDAYGQHREDLVYEIEKAKLPENIEYKVGLPLQSTLADGSKINLIMTEVKDNSVMLDANHPLAGQELTFDIELLEVV